MIWETKPLSSIARIGAGQGAPQRADEFSTTGQPFVRAGSLESLCAGTDEKELEKIPDLVAQNRRMTLHPAGTIVFAKSGMSATLGRVHKLTRPCYVSNHLATINTNAGAETNYLAHFFRFSPPSHLIKDRAYPSIRLSDVSAWEILLPPLDKQKQIAAVLDKADVLRRQRQDSILFIDKLLQSVFLDMFVKNPEAANWHSRSVEWIAKETKGSVRTGPFGSQLLHSEFVDRGIAVLGIDNAVKNRFEWGQPRFITPEKYQGLKRYKVFPGDIIITIMGTLGRCAIIPDDIPEAINTKHLCCVSLDHAKCLPEFLHAAFLNHPDVLRQLGMRSKGAVMPGLNMSIIKELALPMPPIKLQQKFKQAAVAITASRTAFEVSYEFTDSLFTSLQQRAFRGELDLSHLRLPGEVELIEQTAALQSVKIQGRYKRPGSFVAPPEIEAQMMAFEDTLDTGPGDSIPWSEDYFKYRTLSQVLQPPFSFREIWEEVEYDMAEASYDDVMSKIFQYVNDGSLEQRFDEELKEIVFYPRT